MARNARSALGSAGWSLVIVAMIGCSTGAERHRKGGSARSSESIAVEPALVSSVESPHLLVGVSSLEIASPVLDAQVIKTGLTQEQVQSVLARAAQEVMTLKVLVGKTPGEKGGLRKDPAGRAILKTEISQYREREGSAIGGEPAVVAFHMEVVSPLTGVALWKARYFYQQEPLSENWLKINDRLGQSGSGTGWISGRDLLRKGITIALQDFNRSRESQFVVAER